METRSSARLFKSSSEYKSAKNILDSVLNITISEIEEFRKKFIQSHCDTVHKAFKGLARAGWGSKYISVTLPKLSDDFFIAIKKGIFPENCLTCTQAVDGKQPSWERDTHRWVRKIEFFSNLFNQEQKFSHIALRLLIDESCKTRAKQFIEDYMGMPGEPDDASIRYAAFPFMDIEYGILVFGNAKNYNIFRACVRRDSFRDPHDQTSFGDDPVSAKNTFKAILQAVEKGSDVNKAIADCGKTPSRCVIL